MEGTVRGRRTEKTHDGIETEVYHTASEDYEPVAGRRKPTTGLKLPATVTINTHANASQKR